MDTKNVIESGTEMSFVSDLDFRGTDTVDKNDILMSVRATDIDDISNTDLLFSTQLDSVRCCTKHPTIDEAVQSFILLTPSDEEILQDSYFAKRQKAVRSNLAQEIEKITQLIESNVEGSKKFKGKFKTEFSLKQWLISQKQILEIVDQRYLKSSQSQSKRPTSINKALEEDDKVSIDEELLQQKRQELLKFEKIVFKIAVTLERIRTYVIEIVLPRDQNLNTISVFDNGNADYDQAYNLQICYQLSNTFIFMIERIEEISRKSPSVTFMSNHFTGIRPMSLANPQQLKLLEQSLPTISRQSSAQMCPDLDVVWKQFVQKLPSTLREAQEDTRGQQRNIFLYMSVNKVGDLKRHTISFQTFYKAGSPFSLQLKLGKSTSKPFSWLFTEIPLQQLMQEFFLLIKVSIEHSTTCDTESQILFKAKPDSEKRGTLRFLKHFAIINLSELFIQNLQCGKTFETGLVPFFQYAPRSGSEQILEESYLKLWNEKQSGRLNTNYDEVLSKLLNLNLTFAYYSHSQPHMVALRPDLCHIGFSKYFWRKLAQPKSFTVKSNNRKSIQPSQGLPLDELNLGQLERNEIELINLKLLKQPHNELKIEICCLTVQCKKKRKQPVVRLEIFLQKQINDEKLMQNCFYMTYNQKESGPFEPSFKSRVSSLNKGKADFNEQCFARIPLILDNIEDYKHFNLLVCIQFPYDTDKKVLCDITEQMVEKEPNRYQFRTEYVSFLPLLQESQMKVIRSQEFKAFQVRKLDSERINLDQADSYQKINSADMEILNEVSLHFKIELMSQEFSDKPLFMDKINSYKMKLDLNLKEADEILEEVKNMENNDILLYHRSILNELLLLFSNQSTLLWQKYEKCRKCFEQALRRAGRGLSPEDENYCEKFVQEALYDKNKQLSKFFEYFDFEKEKNINSVFKDVQNGAALPDKIFQAVMVVAERFRTDLRTFKPLLQDYIDQRVNDDDLRKALMFRLTRIPAQLESGIINHADKQLLKTKKQVLLNLPFILALLRKTFLQRFEENFAKTRMKLKFTSNNFEKEFQTSLNLTQIDNSPMRPSEMIDQLKRQVSQMSSRIQQKELEMVTEDNEFSDLDVNYYQAQRQSSAGQSYLVSSEHQVLQMVENLTILEKSFNSQLSSALLKIFSVLKAEHLGQSQIAKIKQQQQEFEDLQKYKISILLQQMDQQHSQEISEADRKRFLQIQAMDFLSNPQDKLRSTDFATDLKERVKDQKPEQINRIAGLLVNKINKGAPVAIQNTKDLATLYPVPSHVSDPDVPVPISLEEKSIIFDEYIDTRRLVLIADLGKYITPMLNILKLRKVFWMTVRDIIEQTQDFVDANFLLTMFQMMIVNQQKECQGVNHLSKVIKCANTCCDEKICSFCIKPNLYERLICLNCQIKSARTHFMCTSTDHAGRVSECSSCKITNCSACGATNGLDQIYCISCSLKYNNKQKISQNVGKEIDSIVTKKMLEEIKFSTKKHTLERVEKNIQQKIVKEMIVSLADLLACETFVKMPQNPGTGVRIAHIICKKVPSALKVFREMGHIAANVESLLKFTLLDGLFKFENKFASVFSQTKTFLFDINSQNLNPEQNDQNVEREQETNPMETSLYRSNRSQTQRMTFSWADVGLQKLEEERNQTVVKVQSPLPMSRFSSQRDKRLSYFFTELEQVFEQYFQFKSSDKNPGSDEIINLLDTQIKLLTNQIAGGKDKKSNWMQVLLVELLSMLTEEHIQTYYLKKVGNLKRLINFVRKILDPDEEFWSSDCLTPQLAFFQAKKTQVVKRFLKNLINLLGAQEYRSNLKQLVGNNIEIYHQIISQVWILQLMVWQTDLKNYSELTSLLGFLTPEKFISFWFPQTQQPLLAIQENFVSLQLFWEKYGEISHFTIPDQVSWNNIVKECKAVVKTIKKIHSTQPAAIHTHLSNLVLVYLQVFEISIFQQKKDLNILVQNEIIETLDDFQKFEKACPGRTKVYSLVRNYGEFFKNAIDRIATSCQHDSRFQQIVFDYRKRFTFIFELHLRVDEHERGNNLLCHVNSLYQLLDQFDEMNLRSNFLTKRPSYTKLLETIKWTLHKACKADTGTKDPTSYVDYTYDNRAFVQVRYLYLSERSIQQTHRKFDNRAAEIKERVGGIDDAIKVLSDPAMNRLYLLKCLKLFDVKKKIYKDVFNFKKVAETVQQEAETYEELEKLQLDPDKTYCKYFRIKFFGKNFPKELTEPGVQFIYRAPACHKREYAVFDLKAMLGIDKLQTVYNPKKLPSVDSEQYHVMIDLVSPLSKETRLQYDIPDNLTEISETQGNETNMGKFKQLFAENGKKQFYLQTMEQDPNEEKEEIEMDRKVEIFEVKHKFPTMTFIQPIIKSLVHQQPGVDVNLAGNRELISQVKQVISRVQKNENSQAGESQSESDALKDLEKVLMENLITVEVQGGLTKKVDVLFKESRRIEFVNYDIGLKIKYLNFFKSMEEFKDELETGVFVYANFTVNPENTLIDDFTQKIHELKELLKEKRIKFELDALQREKDEGGL